MILHCPKCEKSDLVNASHGTSRCTKCDGMFVPRSRVSELMGADDVGAPGRQAMHDGAGAQCPQDRSIMARARVEIGPGEDAIHLDRCSSCLGVWFDAGEWQLLAKTRLLDHIDEFWTAEWRTKQRRALDRAEYDKRVRELFGQELYDQMIAMAAALRNHPRRSQALAIIREESDS